MTGADTPTPDRAEIARALEILHGSDEIIELRALVQRGRKRTIAGYYDPAHRSELVEQAAKLNADGAAVYVVMNPLDPQLLGRYANRTEDYAQATATDSNVTRRHKLLIDIDPQRPKDTSATKEQLEAALDRARKVYGYLAELGWPAPVVAESGNGAHLIYRIDLPNDEPSRDLVKHCLEALAGRFDDAAVKIDKSVFNAARIVKLHGTVANKGDGTPQAPWRLSRILTVPEGFQPVPAELLQALSAHAQPAQKPKPNGPDRAAAGSSARAWTEADMSEFLARAGLEATGPESHDGALRWKLKACPFNPEHVDGESAVFMKPDGRLGFKCFHNSCTGKGWRELRERVDGPRESRHANSEMHASSCSEPPAWLNDGPPPADPGERVQGNAPAQEPERIELAGFTPEEILAPIEAEKFALPGIPEEAYSLIAGALSSYKTTLLLYLLTWKASGVDLLGLDDKESAGVEPGPALLLSYEDHDARLFRKLQRVIQDGHRNIQARHGRRDAERFLATVSANMRRITLTGQPGRGIVVRAGDMIVPNLPLLEELSKELRTFAPQGALIGLDPLRLAIVGSQNDDDGADIAVHTLNHMAADIPGSAVIVASHTTKALAADGVSDYVGAAYATSGSALYSQHARSNFHMGRMKTEDIRMLFDPKTITEEEADKQSVARLTHGRNSPGEERQPIYLVMRKGVLTRVEPRSDANETPGEFMRRAAGPIVEAITDAQGIHLSPNILEQDRDLLRKLGGRNKVRKAVRLLADNGHLEIKGKTSNRIVTVTDAGRALASVSSGESRRELKNHDPQ
jgi:hypothetical protein